MPIRPLRLAATVAFLAALAPCANAQSSAAQTGAAQTVPTASPIAYADAQLPRVRAAIEAAERGQFDAGQYSDIARHPLYAWVEYADLRRNIDSVTGNLATAYLTRYNGQAAGDAFREIWLAAAARREDWPAFLAAWRPGIKSLPLRCAELNARQALGRADAQWTSDAQAIWTSTGKSLPDECDGPIAVLAARGGLTDAMRWQRIEAAAAEWQPAVMRSAARGLPAAELAQANDYAAFVDAVNERALTWPKTERSRKIASYGLAKLGKSAPLAAETQLPKYASALEFTDQDRGRVLYQAALWTVASYEPDSARRLNAVPESAYDERLHEWRVREAMSRSDWNAALSAIRKMGAKQRADSRWQYFEARLSERAGDRSTADRLYREAARKPEFHGFLAADRLGLPYALCPWQPNDNAAAKAAVARDPALLRAIALFSLERKRWSELEWNDAVSRMDTTQRRYAVETAQRYGWFDRAVFGLGKSPEEMRLYHLRFPLHHDATIRREAAKNGLDPAWVAAEIRAESVFYPNARSEANAMGLMQILPGTGATVAKNLGIAWGGAASLYDSDTNIVLGTAYLRQLLDRYGGQPYFAIAGYNAGPAPLSRWQSQRPGMDADYWIETISYKETREYVARVLAFSVIYDWRLNGDALTLSDRMRGSNEGKRKRFECPLQAPATDAAPASAAPVAAPPGTAPRRR